MIIEEEKVSNSEIQSNEQAYKYKCKHDVSMCDVMWHYECTCPAHKFLLIKVLFD